MSEQKAWNIAEKVLIPLAKSYESFCKTAYPPSFYSHLKLEDALRLYRFEVSRRVFEFLVSPAFARAFVKVVKGPIVRLAKFEFDRRNTPLWSEDQNARDEYDDIIGDIETATDYLRQLAWMINDRREREPKQSKPPAAKGFDRLGNKKTDLSGYYSNLLTPRQRECFSLRHEYERPVAEIARRLDISRTTVKEYIAASIKKIDNHRENTQPGRLKPHKGAE